MPLVLRAYPNSSSADFNKCDPNYDFIQEIRSLLYMDCNFLTSRASYHN